jgi:hypothetical protein
VYDWFKGTGNGFKMTNLTAKMNRITRLSNESCILYGVAVDTVTASSQLAQARTYYYTKYNGDLMKLVNWNADMNMTSFDDTCEYMYFSRYDPDMQLSFVPQDVDEAYCGAWLNGWIYQMSLALDI